MNSFYNASLVLYVQLLRLVSMFNPKAKKWIDGQSQTKKQLSTINKKTTKTDQTAWFHCASLGEFEQGRPVMEAFRERYPHYKIVLTFFSPSGYEVRKHYEGADVVMYLPIDTPHNVHQFLEVVQPKVVFFVKYEFWHNYLHELKKRAIPTFLFSAIFRPSQAFFSWYGSFYRSMLACFEHIFVQNDASKELLHDIGILNVSVGGDTRFDRVSQIIQQKKEIPVAKSFSQDATTWVLGSVWQQDMGVLIPFINQSEKDKFIIAPHEIRQGHIASWKNQLKHKSICFSEATLDNIADYQVLIIDNVGMLFSLYQYATVAFVGGSFGKGLHNILEPATYGVPIYFGNKSYHKFQEARELIGLGGAFAISNTEALKQMIKNQNWQQSGEICAKYVQSNIGGTKMVMRAVEQLLPE